MIFSIEIETKYVLTFAYNDIINALNNNKNYLEFIN